VFVIDADNQARLRVVQLAPRQTGDVIRLAAGVKEGERVALTALAQLYDSAPVRTTVGPPPAAPPGAPSAKRGTRAEAR
jgi:hypothetical protein